VRFWKKVYVIYSFFFVRKIIAHWVTFCFYCVVLPLTILVPEVKVPIWGSVFIPSIITILNSVGTPRYILFLVSQVIISVSFIGLLICHVTEFKSFSISDFVQKVNPSAVLLDSIRECDVAAPDKGHSHWSV